MRCARTTSPNTRCSRATAAARPTRRGPMDGVAPAGGADVKFADHIRRAVDVSARPTGRGDRRERRWPAGRQGARGRLRRGGAARARPPAGRPRAPQGRAAGPAYARAPAAGPRRLGGALHRPDGWSLNEEGALTSGVRQGGVPGWTVLLGAPYIVAGHEVPAMDPGEAKDGLLPEEADFAFV